MFHYLFVLILKFAINIKTRFYKNIMIINEDFFDEIDADDIDLSSDIEQKVWNHHIKIYYKILNNERFL